MSRKHKKKDYKNKHEIVTDIVLEKKRQKTNRIWQNGRYRYKNTSEGNKKNLRQHGQIYCGSRKMFLYIGKKYPYIVEKLNEKIIIFRGIGNNKRESHNPKNLVFINNVLDFHKSNIDKTLIYNNVSFGRKSYKYLIVKKDYD